MKKTLSSLEVIDLAGVCAGSLGICVPADDILFKIFNRSKPMPLIIKGNGYKLWLDRFYIAYSEIDEKDIRYYYVSEHHINEEYRSYAAASKKRNKSITLPYTINDQFRAALWHMNITDKKYYIFSKEDSVYLQMIVNI